MINTLYKIEMKHHNEIKFEYCFYQNDSIDKTGVLLTEFMKHRKGKITNEQNNRTQIKPIIGRGNAKSRSTERTQLLAQYRNKCLNQMKPLSSKWTLLIDSDIYFDETIIEQFLNHIDKQHTSNIVMYTANSIDNSDCYFDTWGYRDINDKYLSRAYLINKYGDAKIHSDIKEERQRWTNGHPICVNSAFGGCVFIKSDVLNKCKWSAPIGCEHWEFCKNVRQYGVIVVCPLIVCINRETRPICISTVKMTKKQTIKFTSKRKKYEFSKAR